MELEAHNQKVQREQQISLLLKRGVPPMQAKGVGFSGMELENFKAFGESVKIPLAPITLIFGPNSSGKSSILQALYLLKQTQLDAPADVPLLFQGKRGICDLGSIVDTVFRHDRTREVAIGLHGNERVLTTNALGEVDEDSVVKDFHVGFASRFAIHRDGPVLQKVDVVSGDKRFSFERTERDRHVLRSRWDAPFFKDLYRKTHDNRAVLLRNLSLFIKRDALEAVDPEGHLYMAEMNRRGAKPRRPCLPSDKAARLPNNCKAWLVSPYEPLGADVSTHLGDSLDHRVCVDALTEDSSDLDMALYTPEKRPLPAPWVALNPDSKRCSDEEKAWAAHHRASIEAVLNMPETREEMVRRESDYTALGRLLAADFTPEQLWAYLDYDPNFVELPCDKFLVKAEEVESSPHPIVVARRWWRMVNILYAAHIDPPSSFALSSGKVLWRSWAVLCDERFSHDWANVSYDMGEDNDFSAESRPRDEREVLGVLTDTVRRSCEAMLCKLDDVIPLAPVRCAPRRFYMLSGAESANVGFQGEWVPDVLAGDPSCLADVNQWLKRLTDYECLLTPVGPVLPNAHVFQLVDSRQDPPVTVTLADVGYGVSQMLPLLVQGAAAREKVLTVEQPEVHIHPRLQAELGSFLAWSMRNRDNQFIVETHSEHLVLRLQRLVRKGELKPTEVAVLYVSRGTDGANVQRLRMDEEGDFLDIWPDGFFPERLNELFGGGV